MNSLDNMITRSTPQLPREASLVSSVMAKIRQRQLKRAKIVNRSLLVCLVLSMLVLVGALVKGSTGRIASLAVHKISSISAHPGLYSEALLESLPWTAIATVAGIALLARIMHRHRLAFTRHATAAMAVSAGAFLITATATAATITTTTDQPGPAQQQLERVVNGLGKHQVIVNGHTYEFDASLSDTQVRAQLEGAELRLLDLELDTARGSADGGTLTCLCQVSAITADSITFESYGWKPGDQTSFDPNRLSLTSKTIYLKGAAKVTRLDLIVGDLVSVAPAKDLKTAAYVAKHDLPFEAYFYSGGFTSVPSARRSDGKCYNNEADQCPVLPAIRELFNSAQFNILPQDAQIREVFGQIVSIDAKNVSLKSSSGAIWTFAVGDSVSAINEAGYATNDRSVQNHDFQVNKGDYLRIEFWQYNIDLGKREVPRDRDYGGTNIRAVQVALQQPWFQGQAPIKYQPLKAGE